MLYHAFVLIGLLAQVLTMALRVPVHRWLPCVLRFKLFCTLRRASVTVFVKFCLRLHHPCSCRSCQRCTHLLPQSSRHSSRSNIHGHCPILLHPGADAPLHLALTPVPQSTSVPPGMGERTHRLPLRVPVPPFANGIPTGTNVGHS